MTTWTLNTADSNQDRNVSGPAGNRYLLSGRQIEQQVRLDQRFRFSMEKRNVLVLETREIAVKVYS